MSKNFFFSLRYKLILAFLAIGFSISLTLGYVSYKMLEKRMFEEFIKSVNTMTQLSTQIIDREGLEKITKHLKSRPSKNQIDALENSKEMVHLANQLHFIRSASALVRYVYLLLETNDPDIARHVVDADQFTPGENSPNLYDELNISSWPVMKKSFKSKKILTEQEYSYDQIYDAYSVSGYAPIFSKDGHTFLALLGIDMVNKDVEEALTEITHRSILIALFALIISFLTAIFIGFMMTRDIIRLDKLMRQFANNNFKVRANLKSRDEIGRLGFSFNFMADTIQKFISASNRFVPHDLLKLLKKESIIDVQLGDNILRKMTVLFADVRNFTSISEKMNAEDNFNFINSYLKKVGPVVRNHSGIIDKYIGDGIMALFPNRVDDALDAALHIQQALKEYNLSKEHAPYPDVHLGIGIHTGKVMLGTVGEQQRMDGTVISDVVNLSSRLEGLTKIYKTQIIISEKVVDRLSNRHKYFIRYLDKIRVAGKNNPVVAFEVCDADEPELRALKEVTLKDYEQAFEYFYAQRFTETVKLIKKVLDVNPDDHSAQLLYDKATALIGKELPDDWDGTTVYVLK